jgi:hypothetical protein
MPLTSTYAVQESVPAAAVRYMSVRTGLRATDGAEKATDGPVGAVTLTIRPASCL